MQSDVRLVKLFLFDTLLDKSPLTSVYFATFEKKREVRSHLTHNQTFWFLVNFIRVYRKIENNTHVYDTSLRYVAPLKHLINYVNIKNNIFSDYKPQQMQKKTRSLEDGSLFSGSSDDETSSLLGKYQTSSALTSSSEVSTSSMSEIISVSKPNYATTEEAMARVFNKAMNDLGKLKSNSVDTYSAGEMNSAELDNNYYAAKQISRTILEKIRRSYSLIQDEKEKIKVFVEKEKRKMKQREYLMKQLNLKQKLRPKLPKYMPIIIFPDWKRHAIPRSTQTSIDNLKSNHQSDFQDDFEAEFQEACMRDKNMFSNDTQTFLSFGNKLYQQSMLNNDSRHPERSQYQNFRVYKPNKEEDFSSRVYDEIRKDAKTKTASDNVHTSSQHVTTVIKTEDHIPKFGARKQASPDIPHSYMKTHSIRYSSVDVPTVRAGIFRILKAPILPLADEMKQLQLVREEISKSKLTLNQPSIEEADLECDELRQYQNLSHPRKDIIRIKPKSRPRTKEKRRQNQNDNDALLFQNTTNFLVLRDRVVKEFKKGLKEGLNLKRMVRTQSGRYQVGMQDEGPQLTFEQQSSVANHINDIIELTQQSQKYKRLSQQSSNSEINNIIWKKQDDITANISDHNLKISQILMKDPNDCSLFNALETSLDNILERSLSTVLTSEYARGSRAKISSKVSALPSSEYQNISFKQSSDRESKSPETLQLERDWEVEDKIQETSSPIVAMPDRRKSIIETVAIARSSFSESVHKAMVDDISNRRCKVLCTVDSSSSSSLESRRSFNALQADIVRKNRRCKKVSPTTSLLSDVSSQDKLITGNSNLTPEKRDLIASTDTSKEQEYHEPSRVLGHGRVVEAEKHLQDRMNKITCVKSLLDPILPKISDDTFPSLRGDERQQINILPPSRSKDHDSTLLQETVQGSSAASRLLTDSQKTEVNSGKVDDFSEMTMHELLPYQKKPKLKKNKKKIGLVKSLSDTPIGERPSIIKMACRCANPKTLDDHIGDDSSEKLSEPISITLERKNYKIDQSHEVVKLSPQKKSPDVKEGTSSPKILESISLKSSDEFITSGTKAQLNDAGSNINIMDEEGFDTVDSIGITVSKLQVIQSLPELSGVNDGELQIRPTKEEIEDSHKENEGQGKDASTNRFDVLRLRAFINEHRDEFIREVDKNVPVRKRSFGDVKQQLASKLRPPEDTLKTSGRKAINLQSGELESDKNNILNSGEVDPEDYFNISRLRDSIQHAQPVIKEVEKNEPVRKESFEKVKKLLSDRYNEVKVDSLTPERKLINLDTGELDEAKREEDTFSTLEELRYAATPQYFDIGKLKNSVNTTESVPIVKEIEKNVPVRKDSFQMIRQRLSDILKDEEDADHAETTKKAINLKTGELEADYAATDVSNGVAKKSSQYFDITPLKDSVGSSEGGPCTKEIDVNVPVRKDSFNMIRQQLSNVKDVGEADKKLVPQKRAISLKTGELVTPSFKQSINKAEVQATSENKVAVPDKDSLDQDVQQQSQSLISQNLMETEDENGQQYLDLRCIKDFIDVNGKKDINKIDGNWPTIMDNVNNARPQFSNKLKSTVETERCAITRKRPSVSEKGTNNIVAEIISEDKLTISKPSKLDQYVQEPDVGTICQDLDTIGENGSPLRFDIGRLRDFMLTHRGQTIREIDRNKPIRMESFADVRRQVSDLFKEGRQEQSNITQNKCINIKDTTSPDRNKFIWEASSEDISIADEKRKTNLKTGNLESATSSSMYNAESPFYSEKAIPVGTNDMTVLLTQPKHPIRTCRHRKSVILRNMKDQAAAKKILGICTTSFPISEITKPIGEAERLQDTEVSNCQSDESSGKAGYKVPKKDTTYKQKGYFYLSPKPEENIASSLNFEVGEKVYDSIAITYSDSLAFSDEDAEMSELTPIDVKKGSSKKDEAVKVADLFESTSFHTESSSTIESLDTSDLSNHNKIFAKGGKVYIEVGKFVRDMTDIAEESSSDDVLVNESETCSIHSSSHSDESNGIELIKLYHQKVSPELSQCEMETEGYHQGFDDYVKGDTLQKFLSESTTLGPEDITDDSLSSNPNDTFIDLIDLYNETITHEHRESIKSLKTMEVFQDKKRPSDSQRRVNSEYNDIFNRVGDISSPDISFQDMSSPDISSPKISSQYVHTTLGRNYGLLSQGGGFGRAVSLSQLHSLSPISTRFQRNRAAKDKRYGLDRDRKARRHPKTSKRSESYHIWVPANSSDAELNSMHNEYKTSKSMNVKSKSTERRNDSLMRQNKTNLWLEKYYRDYKPSMEARRRSRKYKHPRKYRRYKRVRRRYKGEFSSGNSIAKRSFNCVCCNNSLDLQCPESISGNKQYCHTMAEAGSLDLGCQKHKNVQQFSEELLPAASCTLETPSLQKCINMNKKECEALSEELNQLENWDFSSDELQRPQTLDSSSDVSAPVYLIKQRLTSGQHECNSLNRNKVPLVACRENLSYCKSSRFISSSAPVEESTKTRSVATGYTFSPIVEKTRRCCKCYSIEKKKSGWKPCKSGPQLKALLNKVKLSLLRK